MYWFARGPVSADCATHDAAVMALLHGATTPEVLATGLAGVTSIAVRNGTVYWTATGAACKADASGTLTKRPPSGPPEVLARDLSSPANLFVDSSFAYLTTLGAHGIPPVPRVFSN